MWVDDDTSVHVEGLEECLLQLVPKCSVDLHGAMEHIASSHNMLLCGLANHGVGAFRTCIGMYGEAKVVRTWFLLKLLLGTAATGDAFVGVQIFRNTALVQAGFQMIVELAQRSLLHEKQKPTYDSAIALLKELRQLNEGKWLASYGSILHQLLGGFLKKGPLIFQEIPMKCLLLLFTGVSVATTFLDSLVMCSEVHGSSRNAIGSAFQMFEYAFCTRPLLVLQACAARLVNRSSENASIRMECISAMTRILKTWSEEVPSEVTKSVVKCVLHDASVRVRRSAMQLLSLIKPAESEEEEYLLALVLKLRDQDEKLRIQALEILSKFPMQTLALRLTSNHWKAIFECSLTSKEGSQTYHRGEELLVLFLTNDKMQGPPSIRLGALGVATEDKLGLYSGVLNRHIKLIFGEELKFHAISSL